VVAVAVKAKAAKKDPAMIRAQARAAAKTVAAVADTSPYPA